MKRSRTLALLAVAVPVLFVTGFLSGTASAADPAPAVDAGPVAVPEFGSDADIDVVDADLMAEIVDYTERITPHLYLDSEGLVQLGEVTADELGLPEQFLADFRSALEHSNELIARGEIVVAPDMSVTVTEKFQPLAGTIYPGPDPRGATIDQSGAALDAADSMEPEWGAWNYGSGAMFYNTYPDWVYYQHRYYPLCNSMAAFLGLPYMGPHLIYFYGYNTYYFGLYCYNPYGVYFYLPYGYCGTSLGYKPAYFWCRVYNPGFGYMWAWRGFWCRY